MQKEIRYITVDGEEHKTASEAERHESNIVSQVIECYPILAILNSTKITSRTAVKDTQLREARQGFHRIILKAIENGDIDLPDAPPRPAVLGGK